MSAPLLEARDLNTYYDNMISSLAQVSASESALTTGSEKYHQSLSSQRAQYSGVSLDEEMVQLLKFQRSYQISARVITTVDEMFDTLLRM